MFEYSLHCVLVPAHGKPVPFVVAFFQVLYDIGAGDRAEFSEMVQKILLIDQRPEPADKDFEVFSVHLPENISFIIKYRIPITSVQKNALPSPDIRTQCHRSYFRRKNCEIKIWYPKSQTSNLPGTKIQILALKKLTAGPTETPPFQP
jgi:hypothetical protein